MKIKERRKDRKKNKQKEVKEKRSGKRGFTLKINKLDFHVSWVHTTTIIIIIIILCCSCGNACDCRRLEMPTI